MQFFKIVSLVLLTVACSANASKSSDMAELIDFENNISQHLENVINQAQSRNIPSDTGLLRILKDMRSELQTVSLATKLQQPDIALISELIFYKLCRIFQQKQVLMLSGGWRIEHQALVEKEMSNLLQSYFPGFVFGHSDSIKEDDSIEGEDSIEEDASVEKDDSIVEVIAKNTHISAEACKNIGYIALACLRLATEQNIFG